MLKFLAGIRHNSGWVFIAILATIQGLATLVAPREFTLTVVLGSLGTLLVRIYSVFMASGGILVIIGSGRAAYRVEQIGLTCFLPALFIHALVFITSQPIAPASIWNRLPVILTYICFAAFVIMRSYELELTVKAVTKARSVADER